MTNLIIQNIKNFYDTTVFYMILAIGIFLLAWDYPIFKAMGQKSDKIASLIMGIIFLVLPFALYAVSQM